MSAESDSYLRVAQDAKVESKIKGSRFIGRVYSLEGKEQAEAKLAELRKKEFDATHHCYAYIFQPADIAVSDNVTSNSVDRQVFRYSDDGEPSGSAGKPIYDQIAGRQLVDLLVVVTRYYGGTKLGVGGLVRAYSDSASKALDSAGELRMYHYQTLKLEADFSFYQQILNLLKSLSGEVDDSEFSDRVRLSVRIRLSLVDRFCSEFVELTHGKGQIEK